MFLFLFSLTQRRYVCIMKKSKGDEKMENNICHFSTVQSGDLICTRFVYEQTDAQSKKTFADGHMLGFVIQGKGKLTQNAGVYDVVEGTAFFIHKNSFFHMLNECELKYFYISFHGRRADELVQRFGLSEYDCIFDLSEHYEILSKVVFDCLYKSADRNSDLFGEAGLLYLLAHLDVKKNVSNRLLADMIRLTNDSFTDCTFSLQVLSEKLNYDAKYLSFFFKKSQGICYSQYLRDLRIRRSIFLMEQGITGVKNVAVLSGFSDALYYSKIFKKETGRSPKEYIEQVADGNE